MRIRCAGGAAQCAGLAALFRDAQKIVRRLRDPGVQVRVLGFRGPFRA